MNEREQDIARTLARIYEYHGITTADPENATIIGRIEELIDRW